MLYLKEKQMTHLTVFKSFEPSTHKLEQELIFYIFTLKLPFYQMEVGIHMQGTILINLGLWSGYQICKKVYSFDASVMEQDPVGLSQLAFSRILCFSSSLKYLLNIYIYIYIHTYIHTFDAHVLSCFKGVKTPYQMEDVNHFMTMNT